MSRRILNQSHLQPTDSLKMPWCWPRARHWPSGTDVVHTLASRAFDKIDQTSVQDRAVGRSENLGWHIVMWWEWSVPLLGWNTGLTDFQNLGRVHGSLTPSAPTTLQEELTKYNHEHTQVAWFSTGLCKCNGLKPFWRSIAISYFHKIYAILFLLWTSVSKMQVIRMLLQIYSSPLQYECIHCQLFGDFTYFKMAQIQSGKHVVMYCCF